MQSIKCTVVGNGAVGKTCMLISYTTNAFPEEYTPTVFDNYSTTLMVSDKPVNLSLFDTAGQDDYDRQRPVSYHNTDIFLVCYSLVDNNSLQSCKEKWLPEITKHCPNVPAMLVGTKADLRFNEEWLSKNKDYATVSEDKILMMMKSLGCAKRMECSALTQEGLTEIFEEACKLVIDPPTATKSTGAVNGCCVLL